VYRERIDTLSINCCASGLIGLIEVAHVPRVVAASLTWACFSNF